jgi:hypothetical protein
MKFPGYITAKEAVAKGFTHHGKYFGIPVWLAPDNPDFPVATKWSPMECVMTAVAFIETTLRLAFGDDAYFQFVVMENIKSKKELS